MARKKGPKSFGGFEKRTPDMFWGVLLWEGRLYSLKLILWWPIIPSRTKLSINPTHGGEASLHPSSTSTCSMLGTLHTWWTSMEHRKIMWFNKHCDMQTQKFSQQESNLHVRAWNCDSLVANTTRNLALVTSFLELVFVAVVIVVA